PGDDERAAKEAGVDWYTFTLGGSERRLVFLSLDVLDREVPVDIALFQLEDGKPVPYAEGFERFEPERSTRFAGKYKFIAREIAPGKYYVSVRGNHPAYQLRSETYPVPPDRKSVV